MADMLVSPNRTWVHEAVRLIEADSNRSADTHLHVMPAPDGLEHPRLPQG